MPSTAETMPAIRSDVSGLSNALAASRLAARGKGGEQQSLDHEHETDRDDELGHLCLAAREASVRYFAGLLGGDVVPGGVAPSRTLPDGSTK